MFSYAVMKVFKGHYLNLIYDFRNVVLVYVFIMLYVKVILPCWLCYRLVGPFSPIYQMFNLSVKNLTYNISHVYLPF